MKDTDLLWSETDLLGVYFMNPQMIPGKLSCATIIEWMNEWRRGENNDASSVPKFERSDNLNGCDIRVQFGGMYIHKESKIQWHPYSKEQDLNLLFLTIIIRKSFKRLILKST